MHVSRVSCINLVPVRYTLLTVSLRARRDTTQVMLGVSRARWDATLVDVIIEGV